ncbi:MAG: DUF87 domain-containing protein [Actinobacteria bacterium]|nr:DUF87 domain-containing protein [Actinomycetota bacterium]
MSEPISSLSTPTDRRAALNVGAVESVSPARITVALELDAPRTTALNTGSPVGFPRLNGFVVVPNESGALVGIVTWLGVEHSSFPKRPGMKDFGLVDLPFPLRKMAIVPVGTLERSEGSGEGAFVLRRGVVAFPSVGDPVALPSSPQLQALTHGDARDERVVIGRSLLGNDAEVHIDPDKLFGRHLAVLGNTGSGKSCTVAGLIRWSLEAARKQRESTTKIKGNPNARFIVLDPSGEYREAFKDVPGFRMFQVPPIEDADARKLRVPAWLLNSHEWSSVTFASPKVQRPVLFDGLRKPAHRKSRRGRQRAHALSSLQRARCPDQGEEGDSPQLYRVPDGEGLRQRAGGAQGEPRSLRRTCHRRGRAAGLDRADRRGAGRTRRLQREFRSVLGARPGLDPRLTGGADRGTAGNLGDPYGERGSAVGV